MFSFIEEWALYWLSRERKTALIWLESLVLSCTAFIILCQNFWTILCTGNF